MELKRRILEPVAVDPQTAASMLDVSVSTLRRWRREGRGPKAVKVSQRLVRYRPEDLRRFLQRLDEQRSTDSRSVSR